MRPKILAIVLLTFLGLAALIFIAKKPQLPRGTVVPVSEQEGSNLAAPTPVVNSSSAPVAVVSAAGSETNHAEYVRQRSDELMALAMHNDAVSLETILSELQNPDRQIRHAALEATIQFSDRAAIPRLRELAAQTEDAEEKEQFQDAADYLALPSLTEVLARQQAERTALGITNVPQPRTNRVIGNRLRRPPPNSPASQLQ